MNNLHQTMSIRDRKNSKGRDFIANEIIVGLNIILLIDSGR